YLRKTPAPPCKEPAGPDRQHVGDHVAEPALAGGGHGLAQLRPGGNRERDDDRHPKRAVGEGEERDGGEDAVGHDVPEVEDRRRPIGRRPEVAGEIAQGSLRRWAWRPERQAKGG